MTRPPRRRGAFAAASIARHGPRFTATILIAAAAVGIGVGVAAPEITPLAPAQTTAVAATVPLDDDTATVPQREAPGNRGAQRGGRR